MSHHQKPQRYVHEKVVRDKDGTVIYKETITIVEGPDGLIEKIEGFDLLAEIQFESEQQNQELQRLLRERDMTLREFVATGSKELAQLKHERDHALAESESAFSQGYRTAQLQLESHKANQQLRLQANQQAINVVQMKMSASLQIAQMKMASTQKLINQMNSLVGRSLSGIGRTSQFALPHGKE